MFTTYLEYCGVSASITTNWEVYHDFINLYLKHFVSIPTNKPELIIYSIFPDSQEKKPISPPFSSSDMRKLGPDIRFEENRIFHQRGNLHIFVKFNDKGRVYIHCEDLQRSHKLSNVKAKIKNYPRNR